MRPALIASSRSSVAAASFRSPRLAVRVSASGEGGDVSRQPCRFDITGRHVLVSPELEEKVITKLRPLLHQLQQPEVLESEGGIDLVEVRLMNSEAEVTLHPQNINKRLHDTYLQRGALRGRGQGGANAESNLDLAVEQLARKLHRWSKGAPIKKDYRRL